MDLDLGAFALSADAVESKKGVVSDAEWKARVELAACYRLVALYGWDDTIDTHISYRLDDDSDGQAQFLINPYGMMFEEITASSLVKIDMDGKIIGDSPFPVNPAGFTIHSAVHDIRHDAKCVIHLHTVAGTAVASQEDGLLPLNQTALLVRDQIAWHEYEGVAFNHDERPRLQADLGDKNLMMLWNHGTLSLGESVAEAFGNIYFLERACEMQVATLSQGRPLHLPTDAVTDLVAMQGQAGSKIHGMLAWPGQLRRLNRELPGYDL